jgi:hypothetical protein
LNDTSGASNTAVGHRAAENNLSGNFNIALGTSSLFNNDKSDYNIAVGDNALANTKLTGLAGNIGIGRDAGNINVSGTFNSLFGYEANTSLNNLTNATAIGNRSYVGQSNSMVLGSINGINGAVANTNVGIGTTTPDSTLSIANKFLVGNSGTVQYDNTVPVMTYLFKSGTSNTDRMVYAHSPSFPTWGLQYQDLTDQFNFLAGGSNVMTVRLGTGSVGIGTATPAYQLELSTNSAGKPVSSTWTISSDERLKTMDGSYEKGLTDILKLNTIMYHYKEGNPLNLPNDEQGYGFSAQEVQKIYPEAVKADKDGYLRIDFHPILVSYINAFKEQQQIIDKQQKAIDDLLIRVQKLESK